MYGLRLKDGFSEELSKMSGELGVAGGGGEGSRRGWMAWASLRFSL